MQNAIVHKGLQGKGSKRTVKNVLKECTNLYGINGVLFALMMAPSVVLANPQGGVVTAGSATIANTASELQINQTSNRALIDWSSFNIGAGETTHFYQPSSSAIALNRVTNSGQVSAINGNLLANGQVAIINPNGVLIGKTGNINTAGFVATTANVDDASFMAGGPINFTHAGNANAVVENQGTITVSDAGLAALVAPTVRNSGTITANLGKVQLAAADTFAVDMYGDGLINFAVNAPTDSSIRNISVTNNGSLIADGGQVKMTAAAASSVVDSAINTTGFVQAHSLVNHNGEIILTGAGANVNVSGTVDASGTTGNGGSIKIGGDAHGGGTLAHAAKVNIDGNAVIKANAGTNGNGGNIAVWSDIETDANGQFYARGGSQGGNGGLVETSSGGLLNIDTAYVNTLAPLGSAGDWLLDPTTINVGNSGGNWNTSPQPSSINVLSIDSSASNVILNATSSIGFSAIVNMVNPGVSLTANAGAGGISLTNGGIVTNGGAIIFSAPGGAIQMNHSTLFTQGGNVSLSGGSITINNNSGISTSGKGTQGSISLSSTGTIDIEHSNIDSTNVSGSSANGTITITPAPQSNPQTTINSGAHGGTITINGGTLKLNSDCISAGGSPTCVVTAPLPTLTITADNKTMTFGGAAPTLTVSYSGFVNGDTSASLTTQPTVNSSVPFTSNVGTYLGALVASGAVDYNYIINYVAGNLTINPAALTITANSGSKTYGTVYSFGSPGYTVSGLTGSDTVTSVSLTSTGTPATAGVGSYAVVPSNAVGTGLGNYTISYVNGTLTVNPAALTITANDQSKTYGNTFTFAPNGAGQYGVSGLVNSDTVTSVTLTSAGAPATAGVAGSPYSIVASGATGTGLGNYTISYVNGHLTVNPAALTITANDQSKTYGNTFTFAGTEFGVSGLKNSDTVTSATLSSTGAPASATVAGSPYAIAISNAVGTGLGNYTISYVNGHLTVNPAALSITANSTSKTYGQTVTFNGTEFTTSGLKNSDTVTSASIASAGAAATAGVAGSPYTITIGGAAGTGLGNYTITYHNGTLTVNPASLTITANDQSKTYGSTFTFTGHEFGTSGLVNGDTVTSATLTSAGAPAAAGAGNYPIVASNAVGTGLGNYIISYVNGNMAVGHAILTITADDKVMVYGGSVPTLTASYSGFINGDTPASLTTGPTLSTTGTSGSNVGSYVISASGAVDANYTIVYVDGHLTINPAALTITANNQSKTYGDTFTFNGTEFGTSGLVNGDTVSNVNLTSTGAPATASVGNYAINASGATGTGLGNYTITYVDGSMTVNPAALTITAYNQGKTYGDTVTFNGTEFFTNGLVNGDTVDSATLSSAGAAPTAHVAGSPYAINISNAAGTGLGNYTITYVDGNLYVFPKGLTVVADDKTKVYGTPNPTFTDHVIGLVNGDSDPVVGVTFSTNSTGHVGNWVITPSGGTSTNSDYYISGGGEEEQGGYINGTLTITPAALTITANNQSKTAGTLFTFNGTEFSTAGLVNGDTVSSATLDSPGAPVSATAAGSPYPIHVSNAIGTNNLSDYIVTYVDGVMTIGSAPKNAPAFEIGPLNRPILSVYDNSLDDIPPFKPYDTTGIHTDVSIKNNPPAGGNTPEGLAGLSPSAGGNSPEDLANLSPSAGGNYNVTGGPANGDIRCSNGFLDNKSCAALSY